MVKKFAIVFLVLFFQSCGTSKGYLGEKQPSSELATIYTSERQEFSGGKQFVLMEQINDVEVGNDWDGWPSKAQTIPGEVKIKIKFDTSNFGKTLAKGLGVGVGGAIGGAMVASATNESGPRSEFTATVEKGKSYRIVFSSETHSVSDLKV
jgi:hypothetical protein